MGDKQRVQAESLGDLLRKGRYFGKWESSERNMGSLGNIVLFKKPVVAPGQDHWSFPLLRVGKWRRQWQPTPVLLPRKSHGWRSLVGCSLWGCGELDWASSLSHSCIGEGNGNPLQCSCLGYPRDGGAWWAAVYGVAQSRTWLKRISSSSSSRAGKSSDSGGNGGISMVGLGAKKGPGLTSRMPYIRAGATGSHRD